MTTKEAVDKKLSVCSLGEELAAKYLKSLGWKIITRNHKTRVGEIDIVAREPGGVLVMVEVKTLSGNAESLHRLVPEDHLTFHKLSKLRALSAQFSNRYPQLVQERHGWRIDLVAGDYLYKMDLTELVKNGNLRHYEKL